MYLALCFSNFGFGQTPNLLFLCLLSCAPTSPFGASGNGGLWLLSNRLSHCEGCLLSRVFKVVATLQDLGRGKFRLFLSFTGTFRLRAHVLLLSKLWLFECDDGEESLCVSTLSICCHCLHCLAVRIHGEGRGWVLTDVDDVILNDCGENLGFHTLLRRNCIDSEVIWIVVPLCNTDSSMNALTGSKGKLLLLLLHLLSYGDAWSGLMCSIWV